MTDQTEAPKERDSIFAAIGHHGAARRAYENKAAAMAAPGLLAGPELDELAVAMTEPSNAIDALLVPGIISRRNTV